MNAEQQLITAGFRQHLLHSGVEVVTDAGATLTVLIDAEPMLVEPFQTARQKTPIYATITALAEDVISKRTVVSFADSTSGRTYRVIEVRDNHDPTFNVWLCEVQRT